MSTCLLTTTNTRDRRGSVPGRRYTRYSSPRFTALPDTAGHPWLLGLLPWRCDSVWQDLGGHVRNGLGVEGTHARPFRLGPICYRSYPQPYRSPLVVWSIV